MSMEYKNVVDVDGLMVIGLVENYGDKMTDFRFAPDMFMTGPYSKRAVELSDFCNQKLQEWLRDAPVVYGHREVDPEGTYWTFSSFKYRKDTHKACLICIEELK